MREQFGVFGVREQFGVLGVREQFGVFGGTGPGVLGGHMLETHVCPDGLIGASLNKPTGCFWFAADNSHLDSLLNF